MNEVAFYLLFSFASLIAGAPIVWAAVEILIMAKKWLRARNS